MFKWYLNNNHHGDMMGILQDILGPYHEHKRSFFLGEEGAEEQRLYPYSLFKWGTKELLRVSQAHDSYGLRGILWDILLEFLDIFYRESQKAHGLPTGCSCHWHFLATRPRKKGWLRPGNCNLRCENQGAKGLPWFGCRIPVEGGRLFHLLGGHGCGFGGREAAMWPLLSSQMS